MTRPADERATMTTTILTDATKTNSKTETVAALAVRKTARAAARTKTLREDQKAFKDQKARGRDGKQAKDSVQSPRGAGADKNGSQAQKDAAAWTLGKSVFQIQKIKGKKTVMLPIRDLQAAVAPFEIPELEARSQGLRGRVLADGGCKLMDGEKLVSILKAAKIFGFTPIDEKEFDRKFMAKLGDGDKNAAAELCKRLKWIMRSAQAKSKGREMGFAALYTDQKGNYWFKVSRGFSTALAESLASLEFLSDDPAANLSAEDKKEAGFVYSKLRAFFD